MKKIWPWLLLLLLLIIFCVWSKKDSIQLNTASTTATAVKTTPLLAIDSRYIEFMIAQKEHGNTLNGKFTNIQQQTVLSNTCRAAASNLMIENTSTNKTLLGNDVVELTNKILPHFLAHYTQGQIHYSNQILKVSGLVDSYEAQHEMQRLLNTSTLASQDNSSVLSTQPIAFSITKDLQKMHFKGTFKSKEQMNRIHAKLPQYASTSFTQDAHRVDNGAIAVTEKILPHFTQLYTHGKIVYQDEVFVVSGMVETEEDLALMKQLLSTMQLPVVNHTTIDLEAMKARKAEEAIKLSQLEAEEKAQKEAALSQAAALAKQKAQETAQLAQLEAEKKAQKEAALSQAAALAKQKAQEAEKLAQLEAEEKAKLTVQAQHKAQAAKEKITQLLQVENIEFETAKGSLTPKGKETVDKLAVILQQYPTIKAEIAGHTDSDGSAEFNQKLSQARVETVKGRLIARGINAGRLTAKGYGESKPLVPNTTDANKQKNRRVEINILGE